MSPQIEFFVFAFTLSIVLTYAWWTKFRVWVLREDLFAIRDELWDAILEQGRLDDPDHRRVRAVINDLIRMAPLLSLWGAARILFEGPRPDVKFSRPRQPRAAEALDAALTRVTRYLLYQTVSGLLLVMLLAIVSMLVSLPFRQTRRAIDRNLTLILESAQMSNLSRLVSSIPDCLNSNV